MQPVTVMVLPALLLVTVVLSRCASLVCAAALAIAPAQTAIAIAVPV
jgi:hypothetical protein